MRVVTTQIGHDQIGSHLRSFRRLAACFLKDVGNTLAQLLGWNTLAHEKTFLMIDWMLMLQAKPQHEDARWRKTKFEKVRFASLR
jgi:hypothetical protein